MKAIPDEILREFAESNGKGSYKIRELCGMNEGVNGKRSQFDYSNWAFMATAPFMISNTCCRIMKKDPLHNYEKRTDTVGITAQMASESRLRTQKWLNNGCNAFNLKNPISNPMSFWTEQDVLLYLWDRKLPIAKVYGDIVKDNEVEGQLDFEDLGLFDLGAPCLKTTGAQRTGCMFCGYGCHLEKPGHGRFEMMKHTHPKQYDYIMRPWDKGGLNYKEVIDWINEHGNTQIRY